jgi:hypothetical protein
VRLAAREPQQVAGTRAGDESHMMELLAAFLAATGLFWWFG